VAFGDLHSMSQFHLGNDMIEWNEITWTAAWTDGWIDAMDGMKWHEIMNGQTNELKEYHWIS
jgi:hypothetical protein